MKSTELAEKLFAALPEGNFDQIRDICAADCQCFQNQGAPNNLETTIGMVQIIHSKVKNYRYEEAVRSDTETGFVEEHALRGTIVSTNTEFSIWVCAVGVVKDGKITQVREYFDSAAAAPLIEALTAESSKEDSEA